MGEERKDRDEEPGESLGGEEKRISHLFPGLRKLPSKNRPPREEETAEGKVSEKETMKKESAAEKQKKPLISHDEKYTAKGHTIRRRLTISLPSIHYEGNLSMRYTCTCKVPHELELTLEKSIERKLFCDVCGRRYLLKIDIEISGQD
ncbi:MAG: hypothetical protein E3J72_18920 [Planctomycetota bacterium]|nr:MAG: hypothetical protein E3J72_18920 [Planctomycetota bacterium]